MTPYHFAAFNGHIWQWFKKKVNFCSYISHLWICQFDKIAGHILNWPYKAAMWCGVNSSWFLGFCSVRKSKWSTNCSTNVSNLLIAKWSGVSPVLSWWCSHYKNPKNKNLLTSLHLATFLSEFCTCQNATVLWSRVSTSFGCFFLVNLVVLTFL